MVSFIFLLFVALSKMSQSLAMLTNSSVLLQDLSAPFHILDGRDDPFREYTVYPRNPSRITEITQKIEEIVKTGSVEPIKSQNRQEFNNVLFWSLTIEDAVAQRLRAALGSDVRLGNGI